MTQRRLTMLCGGYYHIYNRGANRTSIFRRDDNYCYLLDLLRRYCDSLHITMIAYCLMPNHFHWLVRQEEEEPAGLLPQRVCKAYSNAFNNYYHHSGTLFEGSYQAIAVNTDAYLHQVCLYIHANPVRHHFAIDPGLYGPTPTTSNGLAGATTAWWTSNLSAHTSTAQTPTQHM